MSAHDAVTSLAQDRPLFHQIDLGQPQSLSIDRTVLDWIATHVSPGATTLETGAGYTTVVFCALGGHHTSVAPAATEFVAIRDYCESKGISTSGLDSQIDISQTVLPKLVDGPPLDMVLIDGDHAFPAPFIDFYYTADRLKKDGWLLVDDIHIETGYVLRQFLISEPQWEHISDLGKTAVFRRLTDHPVTTKWWGEQPWAARQHWVAGFPVKDNLQAVQARARSVLRIGTRLRSLRR